MRRADRLFELVQRLRGRRLATAEQLAGWLEVSVRTVYRDVADLQARGVPIEGEAGVGYRLRPGYTLPPLMFTSPEAQALVAAVRIAQPRLDAAMAAEAEAALAKILSVLPTDARAAAESLALFAPDAGIAPEVRDALQAMRRAVLDRRKLRLQYVDEQGRASARVVRPLGCFFWGAVWTLAAWCELRQDFRSFRLDRVRAVEALDECFRDEPGRTLADLLRAVGAPPR
ncbi:MAG: YafY family transcriptional regulator [Rubrivivax sp.]|nr:YafY family transcriptional regulator [Rubrivivax sp.]